MALLTALLAAASISVPVPKIEIAEQLFRPLRPAVEGNHSYVMATLNLWVGPNGRIAQCSVGRAVGMKDLAPRYCSMIVGKRLASPRNEIGKRSHAFVTYTTSAFAGSLLSQSDEVIQELLAQPNSADPDGYLSVPGIALEKEDYFVLDLAIDQDGVVTACQKGTNTPDELVEAACKAARGRSFAIRQSVKGEAVSYVRSVELRLP